MNSVTVLTVYISMMTLCCVLRTTLLRIDEVQSVPTEFSTLFMCVCMLFCVVMRAHKQGRKNQGAREAT